MQHKEEFVPEDTVLYFPEPLDCYCSFTTERRGLVEGEYYLVYDPFAKICKAERGDWDWNYTVATPTHRVEKIERWKVLSKIDTTVERIV